MPKGRLWMRFFALHFIGFEMHWNSIELNWIDPFNNDETDNLVNQG